MVYCHIVTFADQWSPIYPEGKKQYDRDFLLQFQADCVDKPIGLPNIPDITLASVSIVMWIRLLAAQVMAWHILKNCWLSYYDAIKNPCAHKIAGYPSATVVGLSVRSLAPATNKFSLCDYKNFYSYFFLCKLLYYSTIFY